MKLCLIGFQGGGKTSVGRKIAALLEMTDEIGAQSVKSNDIKIRFIE